jgi:hypothetical protein
MLPPDMRVLFAALLGIVLGVLLAVAHGNSFFITFASC